MLHIILGFVYCIKHTVYFIRSHEPNLTKVNACAESEGSSGECMKSLRGLRPSRTYEAWVRAATVAGDGPPSAAVACQTNALGMIIRRVNNKNNLFVIFLLPCFNCSAGSYFFIRWYSYRNRGWFFIFKMCCGRCSTTG